jgi:hypothetical protein
MGGSGVNTHVGTAAPGCPAGKARTRQCDLRRFLTRGAAPRSQRCHSASREAAIECPPTAQSGGNTIVREILDESIAQKLV